MTEDKIKKYDQAYYLANKEKMDKNSRAYYQANREKYIAKYKSRIQMLKLIENGEMYYAKNKEEIKYKSRMNPKQSKVKNKQAIIDANLANLLVKKELFKQKLLDESIV